MIVVDYDNQNVVKFYCDKCDFHGEYDIINARLEFLKITRAAEAKEYDDYNDG
jgi:hypothetical protein